MMSLRGVFFLIFVFILFFVFFLRCSLSVVFLFFSLPLFFLSE